jgi:hypothetical protein
MVRVSAVNKYTSPTDIGALKHALFIVLYKSALLSKSPDYSTRLLYVRGIKHEAHWITSYGPVAKVYAVTECGPGQRRRLKSSRTFKVQTRFAVLYGNLQHASEERYKCCKDLLSLHGNLQHASEDTNAIRICSPCMVTYNMRQKRDTNAVRICSPCMVTYNMRQKRDTDAVKL